VPSRPGFIPELTTRAGEVRGSARVSDPAGMA
jgi:hypothetical protein